MICEVLYIFGRSKKDHNEITLMNSKKKAALDADQVSALVNTLGGIPAASNMYMRARFKGKVFYSLHYSRSKRINSVVQFQSSEGSTQFGHIDCFVSPVPSTADSTAALVLPFDARPLGPPDLPLLQQKWLAVSLLPRRNLVAIPIRNVIQKCVYVEIPNTANSRSGQSFISLIPNELEAD